MSGLQDRAISPLRSSFVTRAQWLFSLYLIFAFANYYTHSLPTFQMFFSISSSLQTTSGGIWKGVKEAKYNDYIIYNTPGAKPEEETPEGED